MCSLLNNLRENYVFFFNDRYFNILLFHYILLAIFIFNVGFLSRHIKLKSVTCTVFEDGGMD